MDDIKNKYVAGENGFGSSLGFPLRGLIESSASSAVKCVFDVVMVGLKGFSIFENNMLKNVTLGYTIYGALPEKTILEHFI